MKTEKRYKNISFYILFFLFTLISYSANQSLNERVLEVNKKSNSYTMTQLINDSSTGAKLEYEVITYVKGEKYRIEQKNLKEPKKEKSITIYDGKNYYTKYAGLTKKINPIKHQENEVRDSMLDIDLEELLYEKNSELTEDKGSYVLKNKHITLYIDKESYLIKMIEILDGENKVITVKLGKYRKIKNEYYFPAESKVYKDNLLTLDSKVIDLNLDSELSNELFEVKEAALSIKDVLKNLLN